MPTPYNAYMLSHNPNFPKETPSTIVPEPQLLFERETKEIVSCAFEVLNALGHGLVEKPYENAMVVELRLRSIPFE